MRSFMKTSNVRKNKQLFRVLTIRSDATIVLRIFDVFIKDFVTQACIGHRRSVGTFSLPNATKFLRLEDHSAVKLIKISSCYR